MTVTVDTSTCGVVKERMNKETARTRRANIKTMRANLPKNFNWKHIARTLKG